MKKPLSKAAQAAKADQRRDAYLARWANKSEYTKVRRAIAMHVLNGMLSSAPITDRTKINVKVWVKKAYEFADELLRQGDKK